METSQQLANRFREVLLSGKWIANTNFKDQLAQVSMEKAVQKVGSINSIAALTFHVNYYIAGVLNVLKGGDLEIRDKFSFDLPPITSIEDWERLKQEMWENAAQFAQHVEALSEKKLAETFVKEQYGTYHRSIEGMIEHCYYHLGQIVLIRKLLEET
ncbi:MAG: DinB family protein [Bacteroidota bacterium]